MNRHLEFLNAEIKRHLVDPSGLLSFEAGEFKMLRPDGQVKKFVASRIVK